MVLSDLSRLQSLLLCCSVFTFFQLDPLLILPHDAKHMQITARQGACVCLYRQSRLLYVSAGSTGIPGCLFTETNLHPVFLCTDTSLTDTDRQKQPLTASTLNPKLFGRAKERDTWVQRESDMRGD